MPPINEVKSKGRRVGLKIGNTLGTITSISSGYVWCSKGFLWGAGLWVGVFVFCLAMLALLNWDKVAK